MFEPRCTITPKLLANIKKIGILAADLNNRRFPGIVMVKLEQAAREMSACSSTGIEGNPLSLTEVKRIIRNNPQNISNSEREVLNYNNALETFGNIIENNTLKFNLNLILQIQGCIIKGLSNSDNTGKLRNEPVFVNDPATGKPVYLPPDHQDVPGLMNDLIKFCVKNKEELDPLIVAGIFHKQFVIIHPFTDGNGRTARLTSKILLAGMGLDTFNLFSFENYYNRNVTQYFKNVGVFGNYYDIREKVDFTAWLEYFTDGIIDEFLRVARLLEAETLTPASFLKLHHRQIIDQIEKIGFITDRDYAGITDRAKPTRNKDFNKLIELGLIERLGKGKATYYKLKK
jgi:Fic family protein